MIITHAEQCRNFTYGDQTKIRECCVQSCLEAHRLAKKVALTRAHPAYELAIAEWNNLTSAECKAVNDTLEKEGFVILVSDAEPGSIDELSMGVAGSRLYPLIFS